jgi:ABC-type Fe3+-siderophore transport system permease subunit
MLAIAGIENSQSDFWAIVVVAAGTGVSSSVVGGVAEEVEA